MSIHGCRQMNFTTNILREPIPAEFFCYILTLYCSGCGHPMMMIIKAKFFEMDYCFNKINNICEKMKDCRVHVKGLRSIGQSFLKGHFDLEVNLKGQSINFKKSCKFYISTINKF